MGCSKKGLEGQINAYNTQVITSNQKLVVFFPGTISKLLRKKKVSFPGIWDRGRGKGEKRKHIPGVNASDVKLSSPPLLCYLYPICKCCREGREMGSEYFLALEYVIEAPIH